MRHMYINLFTYIMCLIVIIMYRDIVSYVTRMLYFLCEMIIIIKLTNLFILVTLILPFVYIVLCLLITT